MILGPDGNRWITATEQHEAHESSRRMSIDGVERMNIHKAAMRTKTVAGVLDAVLNHCAKSPRRATFGG